MKKLVIVVISISVIITIYMFLNKKEDIIIEQQENIEEQIVEEKKQEPEILEFVDVFGEHYQTEIKEEVPKHNYNWSNLNNVSKYFSYSDETYNSRLGIDVSKHQGKINWKSVKNSGIEFAFIRIGYREYGTRGKICLDERFNENIKGAQAVGIDVGVYFFSQAINEKEAKEEAEFVIKTLKEYELQLPVVYDPETIRDDIARTDDVTGEQFTKNTIVFCKEIEKAGYKPMIYSNMLWEAYEYDLEQLKNIPIWYADYETIPQTPYDFKYWQYTEKRKS